MNLIAAYAHSTRAGTLKRLQQWALCGGVALAGLLGAGQALAASPFVVDSLNGTVTDSFTGLMWDQCADGLSGGTCAIGTAVGYTWSDAFGLAATQNAVNYKLYSDWRLPSIAELRTLLKGSTSPTIDTAAFPNTPSGYFWSGTNANPSVAWIVNFNQGSTSGDGKTYPDYVRLVRSGQYSGSFGLFPVGVSGITVSAATLTATSAAAATGHWLVVPRNATPPTWAQIIAGADYPTVTVAAHGSGAMTANTPATLPLASLAAGTCYDLYMVARESTDQTTSNISGPVPFSTLTIATSSIVIDPVTPTTLYAGLDGAGIYKSSNSGTAWTPASTQPANLRVKALVIKPGTSGNSATLFAASYGGGVFKSTDGGAYWDTPANACATLSGTAGSQNVLTLVMAATTPAKLYAGSEAGVFVSENDCVSWVAINTGMP
jgi:hypothetical protein